MKHLFLCCLLLAGGQTVLAQPLTARQIIDKTYAAYKAANTYQDTGEVILYAKNKDPHWYEPGTFLSKTQFQTAFVRKNSQYRFLAKSVKSKTLTDYMLVGSDGVHTKSWWSAGRQLKQIVNLRKGVSTFSGISFSSSIRVPGLLLSVDAPNWNLTDLQKLILLPQTVVAGKTCYHLQGTIERHPVGATAKSPRPIVGPTESHPDIQLWIDTTTFLLIRVAEQYNQGTVSHEQSITYYPLMNQPVRPEALVFDYKRFQ